MDIVKEMMGTKVNFEIQTDESRKDLKAYWRTQISVIQGVFCLPATAMVTAASSSQDSVVHKAVRYGRKNRAWESDRSTFKPTLGIIKCTHLAKTQYLSETQFLNF